MPPPACGRRWSRMRETDPNMRVMEGYFQEIRQAMGTPAGPSGRGALCARLHRGDEEERLRRRRAQAQRPGGDGGAAGEELIGL